MDQDDIQLANMLLKRAEFFETSGEYYHALLDLSAAYRLLSLHNDTRMPSIHQKWTELHQQAAQKVATPKQESSPPEVMKLSQLLEQIQSRRLFSQR